MDNEKAVELKDSALANVVGGQNAEMDVEKQDVKIITQIVIEETLNRNEQTENTNSSISDILSKSDIETR